MKLGRERGIDRNMRVETNQIDKIDKERSGKERGKWPSRQSDR